MKTPPNADREANKHPISVLVITLNEEKCIEQCLESVQWVDDIVVVDSGSDDATVELASRFANVRTFYRDFDDFSSQRNFGMHETDLRNHWVFLIDADEFCPPKLRDEIIQRTKDANDSTDVFSVRRTLFYFDTQIKRGFRDVWVERLVRPEKVSFHNVVHEKLRYEGKQEYLQNYLDHYPFMKGIDHWVSRRNRYSSMMTNSDMPYRPPIRLAAMFSNDQIARRQFYVGIFRRLPCRWVFYLLYNVVFKLSFLDGFRAVELAVLESYSEYLLELKRKYRNIENE